MLRLLKFFNETVRGVGVIIVTPVLQEEYLLQIRRCFQNSILFLNTLA